MRNSFKSAVAAAGLLVAASAAWGAAVQPQGQGIRYVYLIRHGMYDRVRDADDRVANGLNALGHEQASILGRRLAALPVKLELLVSSDFTRARETADDMGRVLRMTPVRDSLLHECLPASDRPDSTSPAGEIALCDSNLERAWTKYMRPSLGADAHDVLVCHGNVIRWFVTRALGADTRRWRHLEIANASMTVIAVRPDGTTQLVTYSDVGHLPVEKQTWSGKGAGWSRCSDPR